MNQLKYGKFVNFKDLNLGDLIFFYGGSHVGIYIGNSSIIHSPEAGQSVKITNIYYMDYYTARRIVK